MPLRQSGEVPENFFLIQSEQSRAILLQVFNCTVSPSALHPMIFAAVLVEVDFTEYSICFALQAAYLSVLLLH